MFSLARTTNVLHAREKNTRWLRIRLWILKIENLFIRHLWRNNNTRECSRLGRNEL